MLGPLTKVSVDRNCIYIFTGLINPTHPQYICPVHWFGIVFRLVELLGVSLLLSFASRFFVLFLASLGF